MKEYTCDVVLKFSINNFEANNKEDYITKVKDSFKDEYNLDIVDFEIINIEENK